MLSQSLWVHVYSGPVVSRRQFLVASLRLLYSLVPLFHNDPWTLEGGVWHRCPFRTMMQSPIICTLPTCGSQHLFYRVDRVRHCKIKNSRVDTQANTVAIYSKCYALCKVECAILHAPGSTEGLFTSASWTMQEQWLLFGIEEEQQCPWAARIVQVYPNLRGVLGFYATSWNKALLCLIWLYLSFRYTLILFFEHFEIFIFL